MSGPSVAHDVVGLARALRAAGVSVGIEQTESFARALELVDATSRREVFLAARATLVVRREDMPLFEAVFAAFWSGDPDAARARALRRERAGVARRPETAFAAYMAEKARRDDPEADVPEHAKSASAAERLQHKDFSRLTDDELASMQRLLRELRFEPARRVTRRFVAARRGKAFDPRRALRSSSRLGGVLPTLPRRRRRLKRRPIVVLADISGSMEIYSRILLQFFHGLTRLHALTETFVFGTRLTCITGQLRMRRVDEALDHASAAIVDFAGGTRIGDSLRAFNRLHAGRVLRRGAVVLLVSDGWETGDPAALEAEIARLRRRCHRLVWLNPLLGRATYRPLALGMSIALAHVDDFLPVHDLQSLKDLSDHLARLTRRARTTGRHARSGEAIVA
ncbi:MAG TPA: VWA domain-containing protein [Polyangiaceae bacterium]|nr:VWA domain-containing protein [Polyangiaceae bacterium]